MNHIIPSNVVLYNDMMVFKTLFSGNYFGGRSLLARNRLKRAKKEISREIGIENPNHTTSFVRQNLMTKVVAREKSL